MKQHVLHLFATYPQYAFLCSVIINVVIAVLGVVPSVFLTAANIVFFGFWPGILLSFCGEAIGAVVAFVLYRKGFKKNVEGRFKQYPLVEKLVVAQGKDALYAIFILRLIPFVPSGLVTFTAAMGRASLGIFALASSMGKIPALMIEGYAAYQVTAFGWQGKLILFGAGVFLLYLWFRRRRKDREEE